jgi:hypothetical protein
MNHHIVANLRFGHEGEIDFLHDPAKADLSRSHERVIRTDGQDLPWNR